MQYTASHGKFYDICKDDHSSETRKASRQDNQTLHSYRITFSFLALGGKTYAQKFQACSLACQTPAPVYHYLVKAD